MADKLRGKVSFSFYETANKGEFRGKEFKGWILKMLADERTSSGEYADRTLIRTNTIFLEEQGMIYFCKKEKQKVHVFGGNQMMNEFLSSDWKETIDIEIIDFRDLMVEFDFEGKDIDGADFDQTKPLYEKKGTGIRKALRDLQELVDK